MDIRSTTILAVKRDGRTVLVGDGQVTLGQQIIFKSTAHKVRRIYNGNVLVGCAGGAADAFAMSEEFEKMLNKFSGSLVRSAVEYAKVIRAQRNGAEAMIIVADKDNLLIISSNGDVIEPDDGICAIGSGGNYALSAAKALLKNTNMPAKEIALQAMDIASDICVFTNKNFVVEEV